MVQLFILPLLSLRLCAVYLSIMFYLFVETEYLYVALAVLGLIYSGLASAQRKPPS